MLRFAYRALRLRWVQLSMLLLVGLIPTYALALTGSPATGSVIESTVVAPVASEASRPTAATDRSIPMTVASHSISQPAVTRLSGANAPATSVAVSQAYYQPGTEVAYVVERNAFADAIVAGTSRTRGPILYVNTDKLPNVVTAELQRLQPKQVIIVGGSDIVSDKVSNHIKSLLATDATITRLSGASRYETAVDVSKSQYATSDTVYVSNGRAYADSIAATQQQAAGPLLYSKDTSIPYVSTDEIKRLQAKDVIILGGSDTVSNQVIDQIKSRTGAKVKRISGPNRYDTAVELSKNLYPDGVERVFITEGRSYADSILVSSIPQSGALLYTRSDDLPGVTKSEIQRLGADQAVIIGGPVKVAEPVGLQIKQIMTGSQLQQRLEIGVSYFMLAHPDDEIAAWSAIDASSYPVFVLLTQGEASGFCRDHGGKGSQQCKDRRLASFHSFLNNYYSVQDYGLQHGGYQLYLGDDSARLIFDLGDGNLTQSEVVAAIDQARQVDYRTDTENYLASGNYWEAGQDPNCSLRPSFNCGYYDHRDHRAVQNAIASYNHPNKITFHGSFNPTVTAGVDMGRGLFGELINCQNGTYNQAYSWLNPPCWTPSNSHWTQWNWIREY